MKLFIKLTIDFPGHLNATQETLLMLRMMDQDGKNLPAPVSLKIKESLTYVRIEEEMEF